MRGYLQQLRIIQLYIDDIGEYSLSGRFLDLLDTVALALQLSNYETLPHLRLSVLSSFSSKLLIWLTRGPDIIYVIKDLMANRDCCPLTSTSSSDIVVLSS